MSFTISHLRIIPNAPILHYSSAVTQYAKR